MAAGKVRDDGGEELGGVTDDQGQELHVPAYGPRS